MCTCIRNVHTNLHLEPHILKKTVLASLDKNKPIQEILNVTFLFSTAQDGRTTPIRAHKKRQKVVLAVQ